jgi:hypothetical protein
MAALRCAALCCAVLTGSALVAHQQLARIGLFVDGARCLPLSQSGDCYAKKRIERWNEYTCSVLVDYVDLSKALLAL